MTTQTEVPLSVRPVIVEPRSWRRGVRWFAAEFLVVVTGVLVALALNAIYQRIADRRNESTYLTLLHRDLRQTVAQLQDKIEFESAQEDAGLMAYRALSGTVNPDQRTAVSENLGKLADRRTMLLREATYQDLLSTGNLRLIRDRELRDRIVDFYETTRGEYDILNRNNTNLVDALYVTTVIGQGLVSPGRAPGNTKALADMHTKLAPQLHPGYIDEPDRVWSLPAAAPEWAELKSVLLTRIRLAALSETMAQQILVRTRALVADLDAERNAR